jgi:hypothetical protein
LLRGGDPPPNTIGEYLNKVYSVVVFGGGWGQEHLRNKHRPSGEIIVHELAREGEEK